MTAPRPLELAAPGPSREHLNRLVLTGAKVADLRLASDAPPPRVGDDLTLVGNAGEPAARVRVAAVDRVRLGDVTWAQVEAEGEGFASVADWRRQHEQVWRAAGEAPGDTTELMWTRFHVVSPRPVLPPRPTAGDLELPEGYRHVYGGKVRDLFRTPDGDVLVVASDRISAYDWVLPTTIPDKGRVLNRMSLWWFDRLADLVPNHVVSTATPGLVGDRGVVCRELEMLPVECVVRGYLTGSGLADYRATGQVCGNALPPGLDEASRLPTSLFTPATKAAVGDHDENVDFDRVVAEVGPQLAADLRDTSLAVYARAEEVTRARGIILADTKFEFGRDPGGPGILLADEVLTPDSSRYWAAAGWRPGAPQPSFDKQYVRDWLTSPESGWDRAADTPPPPLPPEVVARTRAKYLEAYELITGETFP